MENIRMSNIRRKLAIVMVLSILAVPVSRKPKTPPTPTKAAPGQVSTSSAESSVNESTPAAEVPTLFPITRDNLSGYMDNTGKIIIKPDYESVHPFMEGLAAVATYGASSKIQWGFIDETGKMVIEPQFDDVSDFSDDLAAISRAGNGALSTKPERW